MKIYDYARMKVGFADSVYTCPERDKASHREVIEVFAAQGFGFVGIIPVKTDSYGRVKEYDLVFEKEV